MKFIYSKIFCDERRHRHKHQSSAPFIQTFGWHMFKHISLREMCALTKFHKLSVLPYACILKEVLLQHSPQVVIRNRDNGFTLRVNCRRKCFPRKKASFR